MCASRVSPWLLNVQKLHLFGACILPSNSLPQLFVREENERRGKRRVGLYSREWTNMMYVRDGTRSKYVTRGSSEDWAGPWPVDNYSFGCVSRYHCYEQCFYKLLIRAVDFSSASLLRAVFFILLIRAVDFSGTAPFGGVQLRISVKRFIFVNLLGQPFHFQHWFSFSFLKRGRHRRLITRR